MTRSQAVRRTLRGRGRLQARRGTALLGVVTLASIGLVATGGPAQAVHDLKMQLDGDTNVDSTPSGTYDWESFFDNSGTGGDLNAKAGNLPTDFVARGFKVDYQLPEVTTFATGSKDTLNIGAIPSTTGKGNGTAAGWQCGNSNNLGAKDDLVNVYVVAYRDPTSKDIILYFGAEKSSNLGDNNIGIWFLQDSSVDCTVASNGHNTNFAGHHSAGDVLLTAAFTNGGTVANVEAHVWEKPSGTTANGGEGFLGDAQSGFLCDPNVSDAPTNTTTGANVGCAITNDASNQPPDGSIDPPWNHPVKTPGSIDADSLAAEEFYEGGVDVTQAANNAGVSEPCITTFVADTRSSQSPTATLFDFARGSFPVCHPSTTMQLTAPTQDKTTVHVNENVTYTFYEKNDGDISLNSPSVTTNDSNCSTATSKKNTVNDPGTAIDETLFNVGDTDFDNKLDPGETWQFTCTTSYSSAGTGSIIAIGHAIDPLSGNDVTYYEVSAGVACTEGDVSNGRLCDPQERATASVTVVNPGTTLREEVAASLTFTYYERNTGDTGIQGSTVNVTSSHCTGSGTATPTKKVDDPATTTVDESLYNVGDADNDNVLDPGETWTFTCTASLALPFASPSATYSDTGTGHGTDSLGRAVPTTNESDSSSVTLTNATPNPWPTSSP
jgi:hypothetical protein